MKRQATIEEIVEQCLHRLDAGEDVAACLREYPDQRDVLAPLLEVAAELRHLPPVRLPEHVRTAAWLRVRVALADQAVNHGRWPMPRRWVGLHLRAISVVLALLLLLGTVGGTVVAAQQSLPGARLYGVKRASETVRLQLTVGPAQQALLYLSLADRRAGEILALRASGRSVDPQTLNDLARDYQRSWESIEKVDEAAQGPLIARYADVVREHQEQFAAAAQSVEVPADRAALDDAARVNATAISRVPAPAPTPRLIPTTPLMPTPAIIPTVSPTPTSGATSTQPPTPTLVPTLPASLTVVLPTPTAASASPAASPMVTAVSRVPAPAPTPPVIPTAPPVPTPPVIPTVPSVPM